MVGSCPVVHGRGNNRNAWAQPMARLSFWSWEKLLTLLEQQRQSATLPAVSSTGSSGAKRGLEIRQRPGKGRWRKIHDKHFTSGPCLCPDYKALLCPSRHHDHTRQGAGRKCKLQRRFLPSITGLEPRTALSPSPLAWAVDTCGNPDTGRVPIWPLLFCLHVFGETSCSRWIQASPTMTILDLLIVLYFSFPVTQITV